ncbi:hypothetical protein L6452_08204 [Arctium lappa]|uniref:Uncharacterized protein n=1 Tax=Arctium lappa TaxID=4217 RepID=A0ACB9DH85_ARCLA|nr:hypothetical protein L6452_08204 [Arctium lappa]
MEYRFHWTPFRRIASNLNRFIDLIKYNVSSMDFVDLVDQMIDGFSKRLERIPISSTGCRSAIKGVDEFLNRVSFYNQGFDRRHFTNIPLEIRKPNSGVKHIRLPVAHLHLSSARKRSEIDCCW